MSFESLEEAALFVRLMMFIGGIFALYMFSELIDIRGLLRQYLVWWMARHQISPSRSGIREVLRLESEILQLKLDNEEIRSR